ncbi:MAG: class I SAM-dependent methyltransferase [Pseudomonadota bacterium]
MGLQTVTGLGNQGFFIPYRHAAGVASPKSYPAIEALFERQQTRFQALLQTMADLGEVLAGLNGPPPRPRWNQGWFARLDGAAAYSLVRTVKPSRIIEIGSGHSTRFMHAALADGGIDCRLTAIDPQPRADIAALPIEHVPATLQDADLAVFDGLAAGDILFVDSSHILMPGSDVDLVLSDLLHRLPPGGLVHFHDILLPDGYPANWQWRGYNEQQGVAALLAGGGFEPIFASHYVATRMASVLTDHPVGRLPLMDGVPETSLWLRKLATPLGGISPESRE